jgi:hypothetical protein
VTPEKLGVESDEDGPDPDDEEDLGKGRTAVSNLFVRKFC